MSKRVLVTGVNGFVGHHVAHELASEGHVVLGTGLDTSLDPMLSDVVGEFYATCDLTDERAVAQLPLQDLDAIINLAGLAQVGASFAPGQAEKYNHINVAVHTTIVRQLQKLQRNDVRIIAISTGAVYDNSQPMPLDENGSLVTTGSPYALSKVAMEKALAELRTDDIDIVIARPFNHIGPGQLPGFLVPDLITKLRELDESKTLAVGRLDTKRDYTDVRDVARAYRLLATTEHLAHRIYNVCSGTSHSGQEILDTLIRLLGLQDVEVTIDKERIRPNDPADVRGDASRLQQDTGWRPRIAFEATLKDCLTTKT